ncbi:hypothetical protein [Pseudoalteromonas sp. R3]|nr:hypothetical protein [Pseudoalteromonas sp. R3]
MTNIPEQTYSTPKTGLNSGRIAWGMATELLANVVEQGEPEFVVGVN